MDEDWPTAERGRLIRIVENIRQQAYGEAPAWEREKCDGCDYLLICRPDGIP